MDIGVSDARRVTVKTVRPFRWAFLVVLTIALIWLAWVIVGAVQWSEAAAPVDETAETAAEPNDSNGMIAAAARRFADAKADEDVAAAKALAQRSLVADPLNYAALMLLSDIAAKQGDEDRANILLLLAASRSLRFGQAQMKMLRLLIEEENYKSAIDKSDMLLRLSPGAYYASIIKFLSAAALTPKTAPLMIEALAKRPTWRRGLFQTLAKMNDLEAVRRLMLNLAVGGDEISVEDQAPLLAAFILRGDVRQAYDAWMEFLPDHKIAKADLLFDGDFVETPSKLPFEWTIAPSSGVSVELIDPPDASSKGKTLRIDFLGGRVAVIQVRQVLALPPGRYRFAAKALAEDLRATRGVVWRIACVASNKAALVGATEPLLGSAPWRDIGVDFAVPAENCDAQMLQLAVAAKSPVEQTTSGAVAFRNLSIVKIPP